MNDSRRVHRAVVNERIGVPKIGGLPPSSIYGRSTPT